MEGRLEVVNEQLCIPRSSLVHYRCYKLQPAPTVPLQQVSPRGVLWNFAGAVVVRLLAMVLIPTVVSLVAGAWTGEGSADGQFVQVRTNLHALL